jgi:hypothetical protein
MALAPQGQGRVNRCDWETIYPTLAGARLRVNPGLRLSPYPTFNFDGRVWSELTGSRRLPGDIRLSELPAPDRSFRYALEGRQCVANFGNSSTRTRPATVAHGRRLQGDPSSRQQLLDTVHGPCREQGLAVLWATHLIEEVNTADRLLLLHQGTVHFNGGIDAFMAAAEETEFQTEVLRSLQKA